MTPPRPGRTGASSLSRREFTLGGAAGLALFGCGGAKYLVTADMLGAAGGQAARTIAPARAARPSAADSAPGAAEPGAFIVDIHSHTFNARDLPLQGFVRGILRSGVAGGVGVPDDLLRLLDRTLSKVAAALVARTPSDADDANDLAECLRADAPPPYRVLEPGSLSRALSEVLHGQALVWAALEQLVPALEIATQGRRLVAATLLDQYPEVTLFTPALVDYKYWTDTYEPNALKKTDRHGPSTSLEEQMRVHALVSTAAMKGTLSLRSRAAVHPFIPFNPLREVRDGGALDLVRDAVENQGYIGVKLYPASGFLPIGNERIGMFRERARGRVRATINPRASVGSRLDGALSDLYGYCEKHQVPILAHANHSNGLGDGYSWRGTPWGWAEVLERWPGLRVNLGHFGDLAGVGDDYQPSSTVLDCIAWSRHIAALMVQHDGLYADLSFSEIGFGPARADKYMSYFVNELVPASGGLVFERAMYGTDWWMTQVLEPSTSAPDYLASFRASLTRHKLGASQANLMGRNAMRYLGLWTQQGAPDSQNQAWQRLTRHYQRLGVTAPSWLSQGSPGS
jgi:predicted TIM-barrel fold metal-dependent hydrolase